jgi:hypothetical protein
MSLFVIIYDVAEGVIGWGSHCMRFDCEINAGDPWTDWTGPPLWTVTRARARTCDTSYKGPSVQSVHFVSVSAGGRCLPTWDGQQCRRVELGA